MHPFIQRLSKFKTGGPVFQWKDLVRVHAMGSWILHVKQVCFLSLKISQPYVVLLKFENWMKSSRSVEFSGNLYLHLNIPNRVLNPFSLLSLSFLGGGFLKPPYPPAGGFKSLWAPVRELIIYETSEQDRGGPPSNTMYMNLSLLKIVEPFLWEFSSSSVGSREPILMYNNERESLRSCVRFAYDNHKFKL